MSDTSESARQRPERLSKSPRRVLVVDDNDDAAFSMAAVLRLYGFEVETAPNGEDALARLDRFRPDAAVLDLGMPELDGYETARRIRALGPHSNMVLIASTGWGQADHVRRSKAAGFDHHLVKPVDPNALIQLLSTVGNRRG